MREKYFMKYFTLIKQSFYYLLLLYFPWIYIIGMFLYVKAIIKVCLVPNWLLCIPLFSASIFETGISGV